MVATALFGTIAAYVALAVLLLSLNIASLWSWQIKAGAILLSALVFVVAYFSITGLVGWPASTSLPGRFQLLATRIIEPNAISGTAGHIYLWVEEVDERNLPVAAPRNYEVPYSVSLASDTDEAQARISAGEEVLGQVMATGDQEGKEGVESNPGGEQRGSQGEGGDGQQQGNPNTGAAETIGEAALIQFSEMPVPDLPDKGAIVLGE